MRENRLINERFSSTLRSDEKGKRSIRARTDESIEMQMDGSYILVSLFMHERRIGNGAADVRLAARLTCDWAKLVHRADPGRSRVCSMHETLTH